MRTLFFLPRTPVCILILLGSVIVSTTPLPAAARGEFLSAFLMADNTTPSTTSIDNVLLRSPILHKARCPVSSLPLPIAESCAVAKARLEALAAAAEALPKQQILRMGFSPDVDLRALVAQLYTSKEHTIKKGEDAEVVVTLVVRNDAANEIKRLLRNSEILLLRHNLLNTYEKLFHETLELYQQQRNTDGIAVRGGAWYKALVPSSTQENTTPPSHISDTASADKLEAVISVQNTLHSASKEWLVSSFSLSTLEQASILLPESAAVWLLLAEAQLQSGLPQRSIDSCTESLRLAPSLGRARYIRALAHLRLQQLALAEGDLNASLAHHQNEAPKNDALAARLRARGAVRMLRRDMAGMCEDFFTACALGDCEGLALAREQHQCTDVDSAHDVQTSAVYPKTEGTR